MANKTRFAYCPEFDDADLKERIYGAITRFHRKRGRRA
jgi:hypothetical protein